MIEKYNKTLIFYGLSLVIPWVFWFLAAYISHLPNVKGFLVFLQGFLGILGLIAPAAVALFLFLSDREVFQDLKRRLFLISGFPIFYSLTAFLLIFASMVLAQFISLLFGRELSQFHISGQPSFTSALFSPWFILLFAPVAEEIAWHSYGTDALRRRFNLFNTCLIFSLYWVIWHLPLSFIKGYFHSNLVVEGWIYSVNFIFSLFVFVILMNWIYYKTNRSVLLTIVFHISANISNEIFATHPDSKVIQTAILLVITVVVLVKEKDMFFNKDPSIHS